MSSAGDAGPPPRRNVWADLRPRLLSAAILILITAVSLYVGSYVFALAVAAVFAGAYREWETMVTRAPLTPLGIALIALVALSAFMFPAFGFAGAAIVIAVAAIIAVVAGGEQRWWRAAGVVYFGLVIFATLILRGSTQLGILAGVYLGVVVWMTDSAAFFTGRQIGGEKLAPEISPSKTRSGALGGLALGTIAGLIVWVVGTDSPWWIGLILSISTSIIGQIGDLTESAIKRHFRIKDSGDLIPGHGGLMDRLDSVTFAVLFVLLVGVLHAGVGSVAQGLLYW